MLIFKELFKILIITQDYWIRSSQIGFVFHLLYYLILVGILCLLLQHPLFFDRDVNQVYTYCSRFILCTGIICTFRVIFQDELLYICLVTPVVLYASITFVSRQKKQSTKKQTEQESFDVLQRLLMIVNSDTLSSDDEKVLMTLHYTHRISCLKLSCICSQYQNICIDLKQDKSEKSAIKKQFSHINENSLIFPDKSNIEGDTVEIKGLIMEVEDNTMQYGVINYTDILGDNQNMKRATLDQVFQTDNSDNLVQQLDENLEQQSQLKNFQEYDSKEEFSQAIKKKDFKCYKKAKLYYFKQLITDIMKTDQSSLQFNILYIQFVCQSHHFKAIGRLFQLKKSIDKSGIMFDIMVKISERFINQVIRKHIETKNSQQLDLTAYIESTNKVVKLNSLYDQATQEITDFWQNWQAQSNTISQVLESSKYITRIVQQIKELTKEVQNFSDISRYNQYTQFYLDILNDPMTAAQMYMFSKNKMQYANTNRSIQYKDFESKEVNKAFCLVQAWGGSRNQWEFTYTNQAFRELLGTKQNDLIGMSINFIMPTAIRDNHDFFVKKFFSESQPQMLGKKRVIFLKESTGLIKPVILKLDFMYDLKYNYTFIAQFDPILTLNIISDEKPKLRIENNAMIFLTTFDFSITEINQCVLTQGGFGGSYDLWKVTENSRGHALEMDQFIEGLQSLLQQQFRSNNDPNPIQDKIVRFKRFNIERDNFENNENSILVVLSYYQQTFIINKDTQHFKQRVFIAIPLKQHPQIEYILSLHQNEMFQELFTQVSSTQQDIKNQSTFFVESQAPQNSNQPTSVFIEDQDQGSNDSGFDMRSCSSQSEGVSGAYFLKSLLYQKKAPRILKICAYILSSMVSVFLFVSIYNMAIFLARHDDIQIRIQVFYKSTQRLLNLRGILLSLQMIHQIYLNPLQLDISINNQSRSQLYLQFLSQEIQEEVEVNQQYDLFTQSNGPTYDHHFFFQDIQFLSDQGSLYTAEENIKHFVDLALTYISAVNITSLQIQKPDLNISNYLYTPRNTSTLLEQQLFFIFQNNIQRSYEIMLNAALWLVQQSQFESSQSQDVLTISTAASVTIVTIILLFSYPFLAKLYQRQYTVLKFISFLDQESLNRTIARCIKFQQTFNASLLEEGLVIPVVQRMSKRVSKVEVSNEIQTKKKKTASKLSSEEKQSKIIDPTDIEVQIVDVAKKLEVVDPKIQYLKSQIKQSSCRDKMRILALTVLIIGYLNTSLMISYYYSKLIFNNNADATNRMRWYFKRESCAYNSLLFLRNNLILNQSVTMKAYTDYEVYTNVSSVPYFIQYCLDTEHQIDLMQSNLPSYLIEAHPVLLGVEHSSFCNFTYGATDPVKEKQCEAVNNGILLNGIDAAMNLIITMVTQLNIQFQHTHRTTKYLTQTLNDSDLLGMVDLTILYLRDSFKILQKSVIDSTLSYFAQSRQIYLLIFGIFISLTLVCFIIFGIILYLRLKRRILGIQNILIILPLDELKPFQKSKIEKYLTS